MAEDEDRAVTSNEDGSENEDLKTIKRLLGRTDCNGDNCPISKQFVDLVHKDFESLHDFIDLDQTNFEGAIGDLVERINIYSQSRAVVRRKLLKLKAKGM